LAFGIHYEKAADQWEAVDLQAQFRLIHNGHTVIRGGPKKSPSLAAKSPPSLDPLVILRNNVRYFNQYPRHSSQRSGKPREENKSIGIALKRFHLPNQETKRRVFMMGRFCRRK
jgi:hypothetical protein